MNHSSLLGIGFVEISIAIQLVVGVGPYFDEFRKELNNLRSINKRFGRGPLLE